MSLQFESIPFLLAIPLGAMITFVLLLRSRSELSPRRRSGSAIVRILLVSLLLCAMARPSYTQRVQGEVTTVFLLDLSDSMPPAIRMAAAAKIEFLSNRGQKCALVAFAGSAEIVRLPSTEPIQIPSDFLSTSSDEVSRRRSALDPTRTDFASALRTAETLSVPHALYLFVTDGRDSLGTAPIRPDVRYLILPSSESDIASRRIRAPATVRSGEPFDVEIDFSSVKESTVEAFLMIDDIECKREKILVPAGESTRTARRRTVTSQMRPNRIRYIFIQKMDVRY
jgi:hypothetical protein